MPDPVPPRLSDLPAHSPPVVRPTRIESDPPPSRVPVHPVSALLLIGIDNLWNLADWAVISWAITVPLSFFTVCVPVFVLQKLVRRDSLGKALVLAVLLGGVAALPTSMFGTPVGLALLAWTGIDRLIGRSAKPNP
jgi:hypothetical protein